MIRLDELGFAIPIIDEPVNAIKLLLGFDDIDFYMDIA